MSAILLDGKEVAQVRRAQIRARASAFQARAGRPPGLAVLLVGEDPASQVYVANKIKSCAEVGIRSFERRLVNTTSLAELQGVIEALNRDPAVDGILLQLPLPSGLDSAVAMEWIAPDKDADCLTQRNVGRLWSGRPLTRPCTPWGVMVILDHFGIPLEGRRAVVVGRSHIVGLPMTQLLLQANATVTVCHSRTQDLRAHTLQADVVVVAAGRPGLLGAGDFKPDAVVVDVGMHRQALPNGKTRLSGDVRFDEVRDRVRAITPVPGGVGPMTITMLLENTLVLAESQLKKTAEPRN